MQQNSCEIANLRQLCSCERDLHVTSIDKIRQSIDEVVAQVLLNQAEQLRNEVCEKIRPFLDEDSKNLEAIQAELRQRSEQAQSMELQLAHTRADIAGKQQHIASIEQQLRTLESGTEQGRKTEEELRGRVGELENTLKAETERLTKQAKEFEQLLEMSQEEVKQLQGREKEQKKRFKELEKQVEDLRNQMQEALSKKDEEHEKVLSEKERVLAEKSAEYEQRLQSGSKTTAEAIEAKEQEKNEALSKKDQEHVAKVRELEKKIEAVRREAADASQGKERELLDQVHLLEELLVQGQHAREQQLDAKDRELRGALESQKAEFETRITDLQAQLAEREKVVQQGGELQHRVAGLEGELSGSQKQLAEVQKELQDTQAAFEKTQQQLDDLSASSKKREEELAKQLKDRQEAVFTTERSLKEELEKQLKAREESLRNEFEERQSAWKKREEELLGGHATLAGQTSDFESKQNTWEQREKELTAQLGGLEKRLSEFATAEQSWQQREQELLGHRDQVLSSSAEASEASQKALQASLEDQECLQTQLDAMIEELGRVREELQQAQAALAAKGSVSAPSAPAPVVDEAAAVKAAVQEIHAAHSQSEILKSLLERVSQFSSRSGVLVVHGHTATGWGARGFDSESEFRKLNVECTAGVAARIVQGRTRISCKASEFEPKLVKHFGAPADGQANVFPLVVRERVVAFLYTDCGNHAAHQIPIGAIEAIVNAAGTRLDELAKSKKAGPHDNAPAGAVASVAVEEAAPTVAMAAAAGAATGSSATREAPGTNADVARQRARRFAKLLVDEIKLYNKDAVEVGRQKSDLYDRLREPIDKSRASYEKRWGKTITDVDYFREELVRNLAENNVAVLGNNFPR